MSETRPHAGSATLGTNAAEQRGGALRGLLYAWDERAALSVLQALTDEAWRVREMAIKVAARHRVDDALPLIVELLQDAVARVREAAHRAVQSLTVADD